MPAPVWDCEDCGIELKGYQCPHAEKKRIEYIDGAAYYECAVCGADMGKAP